MTISVHCQRIIGECQHCTHAEISINSFAVDHSNEINDHLCDPLVNEQMEKYTLLILHTLSSFFTENLIPVSLRLEEKSHKKADRLSASSIVPAGATGYNVHCNKKKLPSLISRKPLHLKYQKYIQMKPNNSSLNKGTDLSHSYMQLTDESSLYNLM